MYLQNRQFGFDPVTLIGAGAGLLSSVAGMFGKGGDSSKEACKAAAAWEASQKRLLEYEQEMLEKREKQAYFLEQWTVIGQRLMELGYDAGTIASIPMETARAVSNRYSQFVNSRGKLFKFTEMLEQARSSGDKQAEKKASDKLKQSTDEFKAAQSKLIINLRKTGINPDKFIDSIKKEALPIIGGPGTMESGLLAGFSPWILLLLAGGAIFILRGRG